MNVKKLLKLNNTNDVVFYGLINTSSPKTIRLKSKTAGFITSLKEISQTWLNALSHVSERLIDKAVNFVRRGGKYHFCGLYKSMHADGVIDFIHIKGDGTGKIFSINGRTAIGKNIFKWETRYGKFVSTDDLVDKVIANAPEATFLKQSETNRYYKVA